MGYLSLSHQIGERMNFSDYQTKSRTTARYPAIGHPVIYPALGLVNEAGEVAGKIKKVFRDKGGEISDETRAALKAELGDVLWYVAQVATELDISLDEVAEYNIAKLYDRLERGKIKGDGDNR
jgi:NTP pyrophosphatase (non-canonical NTP hydrolase)